MYFFVPMEHVEEERLEPGATARRVSREGSPGGGLFLWAQAMFVVAQLLTGGLLHVNELDPIRRYLPSYNRPRKGGRYSAFQVICNAFCVVLRTYFKTYFMDTEYRKKTSDWLKTGGFW